MSYPIRRHNYFSEFLSPRRMQEVDGVSKARRSIALLSTLARGDEIGVPRVGSAEAIRDRARNGVSLFNHLPEVVSLLLGSCLIVCISTYCAASVTSGSDGPAW